MTEPLKIHSNIDWITIPDACRLLGISRPTLNVYKKKYSLRVFKQKGRVLFSKLDLIGKVMSPGDAIDQNANLLFYECEIEKIEVNENIFDLRRVDLVDTYGAMTLLCKIKSLLKKSTVNSIYLIIGSNHACRVLHSLGFFTEVINTPGQVYIDQALIASLSPSVNNTLLPLTTTGYRGAEKKILESLFGGLQTQGFSEELCAYLGWSLGELADNAHTHAGGPCFISITSLSNEKTQFP